MRPFLFFLLFILLTACEAEVTPFPVDVPVTPTPTLSPTEQLPVRYALPPNFPIGESDLELITSNHVIQYLDVPADSLQLGAVFDVTVAYGDLMGWTRSQITPHVMLVINPMAAPLEVAIAEILRRGVDPQALVEQIGIPGVTPLTTGAVEASVQLKAELANLGKPDGIGLMLGVIPVPGIAELEAQLAAINVQTRQLLLTNGGIRDAFATGQIQIALVTWITPEEQQAWRDMFGTEWTIDLYQVPIRYLALPELNITLTPGGFPLASR